MLKVVIMTQQDRFYIPKNIQKIIDNSEVLEIVNVECKSSLQNKVSDFIKWFGIFQVGKMGIVTVLRILEGKIDKLFNYKFHQGLCGVDYVAKKNNINIICKAEAPNGISISEIDLCVILGNLLDNAMESCAQVENKNPFIRIYIAVIHSQLYISIQNSAKDILDFNERNYISTKRGNHGLGMKRVKILVDKYEGYLNLQNQPGIFASEVTLPLK